MSSFQEKFCFMKVIVYRRSFQVVLKCYSFKEGWKEVYIHTMRCEDMGAFT